MSFYKNINKLGIGLLVCFTLFTKVSMADDSMQKPNIQMDSIETKSITGSGLTTGFGDNDFSKKDEKSFYFGARGGYSMPLSKTMEFEIHDETNGKTKNKANLKGCGSFEFHFGHFIAPTTSVEFSYTLNSKYTTNIVLDKNHGTTDTKVRLQAFMVNFNYDFQDIGAIPYFSIGGGLAKVDIEASKPVLHPGNQAVSIFEVKNTKNNKFGFQIGLGIKKMLAEKIGFKFAANTIIVPSVNLNIKKFNCAKNCLEEASMKKPFGVFNISAGIDFNF